jgi:hypothetical protein
MPVELVIAPEAGLDIAEAYLWYESRRAGLGEEFLGSVEACLESIRRFIPLATRTNGASAFLDGLRWTPRAASALAVTRLLWVPNTGVAGAVSCDDVARARVPNATQFS